MIHPAVRSPRAQAKAVALRQDAAQRHVDQSIMLAALLASASVAAIFMLLIRFA